jgi:nucleotide sugar dehydrogenase
VQVGVIGLGRVGRSVVELFESHHDVVGWDVSSGEPYPHAQLAACAFAVICVNTPTAEDGQADLAAVQAAISDLPCQRVLLKSTVPPGTTATLRQCYAKSICFWPEYVGESRYYNPHFPSAIADVPFVIIGGQHDARQWFIDRLLPVLGPTKTYFQCEAIEAELIKYAENAFFATKITFVNEYRRVCESFGADWHSVREGWLLDPRVERMHTAAFEDDRGFAGKCLPKDLRAIVTAAAQQGYSADLLTEVLRSNARLRGAPNEALIQRGPEAASTVDGSALNDGSSPPVVDASRCAGEH